MLLSNSRCILLNLYTFSPATFFKHLTPNNKPTTLCHRKTTVKSLATLSHFRTLSSRQRHQIHLYVHAILQWNKRMNLTAVKDADEVMERHVEDSLAILPPLRDCYRTRCGGAPSHEKLSLVDVGTGAGLPGVVLAIACPVVIFSQFLQLKWSRMGSYADGVHEQEMRILGACCWNHRFIKYPDSKRKSRGNTHASIFLYYETVNVYLLILFEILISVSYVVKSLGQNHCFREKFDIAVARAVAEMRVLAEYCLPLVRVGGLFIAAKGHDPEDEVKKAESAIQKMGASLLQVCSVDSRSPYGQRTVVICSKDRSTPMKYPRDPGTPAKEPL
ncbi:hypothetical protein Ahy_A01g001817 isoform A [Arachis hypogaea]|uniref:Ribosomal RNA small subunit methyltransferase G n=1 Tax=Arachis hypogaea TaxID=3818 RepID=A0A445EPQ8_ARAHY|nr:hypothetical protein Ahy_A01g001817 isoform A [Arachis hypogaea]